MASAPISSGVRARHLNFHVLPASVLAQTPPPAAPIQMWSAFAGSQTSVVQRPPILVGPASCHLAATFAAGNVRSARRRSKASFAVGASRNGQLTRARNQAARAL